VIVAVQCCLEVEYALFGTVTARVPNNSIASYLKMGYPLYHFTYCAAVVGVRVECDKIAKDQMGIAMQALCNNMFERNK